MKRKAEFDLDRNELQKNNYEVPTSGPNQNNGTAQNNTGDVTQRRFVKLKTPSQILGENAELANQVKATGGLKLAGSLTTSTDANNNNQQSTGAPSFLRNFTHNKDSTEPLQRKSLFDGLVDIPKIDPIKPFEYPPEQQQQRPLFSTAETPKPLFNLQSTQPQTQVQSNNEISPNALIQKSTPTNESTMTKIPILTQTPKGLEEKKTPEPISQTEQPTSQTKPPLFSSLFNKPAEEKKPEEVKAGSLFSSILNKAEKKEEVKPTTETKTPLFGGSLFNKTPTPETKEPAKTETITTQQENKPAPLAGLSSGGSGLFSGSSNLFSSIFKNSGSLSDLSDKDYSKTREDESGAAVEKAKLEKAREEAKKKAEEQAKPANPWASLATYTKPTTGLFSQTTEGKPNLFSGFSSGTSTFSSLMTGSSSFLMPKKEDDEEGGEGDEEGDDEPQKSPSPEADPTKSSASFQYEDPFDKLANEKVVKFKGTASSPLLPNGEISLNKTKNGDTYYIIFRDKAKLVRYQGQVSKALYKVDYLNPRQDALSVVTISVENGKPQRDNIKIMFNTSDECNSFKKALDTQFA